MMRSDLNKTNLAKSIILCRLVLCSQIRHSGLPDSDRLLGSYIYPASLTSCLDRCGIFFTVHISVRYLDGGYALLPKAQSRLAIFFMGRHVVYCKYWNWRIQEANPAMPPPLPVICVANVGTFFLKAACKHNKNTKIKFKKINKNTVNDCQNVFSFKKLCP